MRLGKNLTLAAARGELDPVVGRDDEIEQALDVLAKREGNNPCLVGVAGVGKTSVVRGLAQRIADGARRGVARRPRSSIEIPIGELVAGTGVRGALAERLGAIRSEVLAASGRVVLFFDEIHQLFAGDAAEEIASELSSRSRAASCRASARPRSKSTRRRSSSDAALARRFTLVEVEEPSREDAFLMLEALSPQLEQHHGVALREEALALGVAWSRPLPARARAARQGGLDPRSRRARARARRGEHRRSAAEAVAEVVAELADMPVERLLETDGERMLRLEELLAERVVGHGAQIARIARILRRNAAGLGSRRPIGTFLLLGPTGVGKTETAKAIAEALFHCESAMTRLDLSEYGEAHAVARLIGAPPGYVGHEAGGQLTEAVRRRPYQVILLDEIEKAHRDVLDAFLGVFDEGRLTDGRGRTRRLHQHRDPDDLEPRRRGDGGSAAKRRVGFGARATRRRATISSASVTAAARARARARALQPHRRGARLRAARPRRRARDRAAPARRRSAAARAQRGVRLEFDADAIEPCSTRAASIPRSARGR